MGLSPARGIAGPATSAPERGYSWAAIVLAVLYAGAGFFATAGIRTLTPDALEYALVARNLVEGAGFTADLVVIHPGLVERIRHPPELHGLLQPLLTAPAFWLFGSSADAARAPGIVGGAGLVLATFHLTRQHFGGAAGLVSALLLAAHGGLLGWTLTASDDVGHALLSTLSLLSFFAALRSGSRTALLGAGVLAAGATLQKVTGLLVPLVFCGTVVLGTPEARRFQRRDAVLVLLPVALAVVAYGLRNVGSRGTLGFSFSAVDWLAKAQPEAYFGYHDAPPRLLDVLVDLGPARVAALTLEELGGLVRTLWRAPLTSIGGPLALLVLLKQPAHRTFAASGLTYCTVLVPTLTLVYHVEARYLAALLPLETAAVTGAAVPAMRWLRERATSSPWLRAATLVLAIAAGVAGFRSPARTLAITRGLPRQALPCTRALEFLENNARPGEAVLTSNPWFVAWETRLPAVQAPTNGPHALATVARHYQSTWALTGVRAARTAGLDEALNDDDPAVAALRPERVFDARDCDVYRLHTD